MALAVILLKKNYWFTWAGGSCNLEYITIGKIKMFTLHYVHMDVKNTLNSDATALYDSVT
jgi:hypothetical protein